MKPRWLTRLGPQLGCENARYFAVLGTEIANHFGMIDVAENWVDPLGARPPGTWMWVYRFDPGDGNRLQDGAHKLIGTAESAELAREIVEAFAAAEALAGHVNYRTTAMLARGAAERIR